MRGHLPQADTWFRMLYDIWLSRSPGGGFLSDGVWPNGNMGYIHVNMESMVSNFLLFRDLFGVNLFRHPWYANCANALAYTVPVGSAGDGFSDGCEHVYVEVRSVPILLMCWAGSLVILLLWNMLTVIPVSKRKNVSFP